MLCLVVCSHASGSCLPWAGAAATGPALPAFWVFWVFWVFVSLISVAPWMSVQLYAGRAGRTGSWPWFAASSARLFGGVIRLDGTFRLICAVHLIDAVQSGFVQRGVAGVGVLAGHVCLVETSSISPVLLSGAETMTGNPVSAVRTARAAYTGRRLDERLVKEERRVGRLELVVHAAAEQVDQRRAVHERGQLLQRRRTVRRSR